VAQQTTDQVHDVKMIDKNERASTIKVILVEKLGKGSVPIQLLITLKNDFV
jgi:hypothetical protein